MGVKEYEVVVVAFIAGDQEPVKPSMLEVGKEKDAPAQYGPTLAKVGVCGAPTETCNVVVEAHCPPVGVNV